MFCISVFESALSTYLGKLSDKDKVLLKDCKNPETFAEYLSGVVRRHHESSSSRKAMDLCQPAIEGFRRFANCLDMLCNAKPEVLAVLWGGLRIVLRVAESFQEFFDAILLSIKTIGENIKRAKIYEALFTQVETVRGCMLELYTQILKFFLESQQLYDDAVVSKRQRFLPRRLQIALKAMLSSFRGKTCRTQLIIQGIFDRLDKEAQAASFMESKHSTNLQQLEFDAAKMHRDLTEGELVHQSRERQEQSDWREVEKQYWLELQAKNQAITVSVLEESRSSLFTWLSPISSEDTHDAMLKLQYPGTCTWILDTAQFVNWTHHDGAWILWAHSITGAGKTILAASIIKHLQEKSCPDEAVAYFYFDHRYSDRQDIRSFLATIVVSLAAQSAAYLGAISKRLNDARSVGRSPSIKLLQECISECPTWFETIFIVLDALDESSDIDTSMSQLLCLGSQGRKKIKLFVTSRTSTTVQASLEELEDEYLAIALEQNLVHGDIFKYVEGEVSTAFSRQRLKLRDPTLKQEIISVLSKQAQGMFQLVKCQLDQIRKLKTDNAIRDSLKRLPKDLNETYFQAIERLIKRHDDEEIVQIQRLFRWLVHAVRPLAIEEMAEVIAVDFGQEKFDLSAVVTEPLELLTFGESLIALSGSKNQFLHLSHYSVKEFLLSDYCLQMTPRFYMDPNRSNAEIAQVCLTALSFKEFVIAIEHAIAPPTECLHLYTYAASHWMDHYHSAQNFESCPKDLAASLLLSTPVNPSFAFLRKFLGKSDNYQPIHYCAQYGLVYFLQEILDSGVDIDINCEPYGSPLNFAARHDRPLVNEFLLDRGANVNRTASQASQGSANNCLHWAMDEDRASFVSVRLVS